MVSRIAMVAREDEVILEPIDTEIVTKGGIILPKSKTGDDRLYLCRVVSVGDGYYVPGILTKIEIKLNVADLVMVNPGKCGVFSVGGRTFWHTSCHSVPVLFVKEDGSVVTPKELTHAGDSTSDSR